jgi:metal-responsive CopG/Arc/MetJ family transcriptional regulator
MDKRTIRIPDDVATEIDRRAEADDVSESAAARQLLRRGIEADELEAERDRLREQLAATNARQDDVAELVEYVEDEQRYRQAGLMQRLKWFFRGME